MKNPVVIILKTSASCGIFLVAGCHLPSSRVPSMYAVNGSAMRSCSKPSKIARVFKISIPDDLRISAGNIVNTDINNPKNEDDDSINDPVNSDNTNYQNNPFHIDLTNYGKSSDGKWFELRIILPDNTYNFYETKSTDVAPNIHGVAYGVGKVDHSMDFCTDGRIHKSTEAGFKYSTAVFYVQQHDGTKGTYENGYNILIMPSGLSDTPIIIDPKVENNG
jgi:hypothetical protein